MKLEFSRHIFEKYSNIKSQEKCPFTESQVVPCGQMDRRTDMQKLIVTLRNFANATKKCSSVTLVCEEILVIYPEKIASSINAFC